MQFKEEKKQLGLHFSYVPGGEQSCRLQSANATSGLLANACAWGGWERDIYIEMMTMVTILMLTS